MTRTLTLLLLLTNTAQAQTSDAAQRAISDPELHLRIPWRLRASFAAATTPRAWAPGGGLHLSAGAQLTLSRWFRAYFKTELYAALSYVPARQIGLQPHGPEGVLGLDLMFTTSGLLRVGGGVGAAVVLAREEDGLDGFAWLGARLKLAQLEVGMFSKHGHGIAIQMAALANYVPYERDLHWGVLAGIGVEIGLPTGGQGATPAAAEPL